MSEENAGILLPVMAGLAVGVGFIIIFTLGANERLADVVSVGISIAPPDGGVYEGFS